MSDDASLVSMQRFYFYGAITTLFLYDMSWIMPILCWILSALCKVK